jgi:hypothetical protein
MAKFDPRTETRNGLPPTTYSNALAPAAQTLYQNPITGEITTTPPTMTPEMMGVTGGGLDPSARFSTADWQASPEYGAYAGARDATLKRTMAGLQGQAGASGMYGSGNVANALASNVADIYATYDPASLAAARQGWEGGRGTEFNMLAGLSNPNAVQQIGNYAGAYGTNAGNLMVDAGRSLAAGQLGSAGQWQSALATGTNALTGYLQAQRAQPVGSSSGFDPGYAAYLSDYGGGSGYGGVPDVLAGGGFY